MFEAQETAYFITEMMKTFVVPPLLIAVAIIVICSIAVAVKNNKERGKK